MGGSGGLPERFREDLTRYVDGELGESERSEFEARLAESTEMQREVAIQLAMKGDLRAMGLDQTTPEGGSVWDSVNKRIARPSGWIFLVVGVLMYAAYAVYTFIQSPMNLFDRLTVGFVVIGFLILLASVAYERIRDFKTDPYKGVER
jgi:hypothetical protein